jgi:hypothetical protein
MTGSPVGSPELQEMSDLFAASLGRLKETHRVSLKSGDAAGVCG